LEIDIYVYDLRFDFPDVGDFGAAPFHFAEDIGTESGQTSELCEFKEGSSSSTNDVWNRVGNRRDLAQNLVHFLQNKKHS
jgi:hypothetical protein